TRPFADPAPKRTLLLAWRVSFPRHKAIDLLRVAIQARSSAFWRYNTALRNQDGQGMLVENKDWRNKKLTVDSWRSTASTRLLLPMSSRQATSLRLTLPCRHWCRCAYVVT